MNSKTLEVITFSLGVLLLLLVENFNLPPSRSIKVICFILLTVPVVARLMRSTGFPNFSRATLSVALIIFINHFFHTNVNDYMYDIGEHKALIEHYSIFWWPTQVDKSWLSFHPPLYYYLQAIIFKFENFIDLPRFNTVRASNIILYVFFLMFSYKIIYLEIKDALVRNSCILFVSFFPINDFYSTRINNDSLLYPLWAAAIYYFLKWHKNNDSENLKTSLILTALAILTKANAYLLLIGILSFLLIESSKFNLPKFASVRKYIHIFALPLILLIIASTITTGRLVINKMNNGKYAHLLVANYPEKFETEGKSLKFFSIDRNDLKKIINPPFPETFRKSELKQSYEIHFLKTFLYGEGYRKQGHIAKFLNLTFISMTLLFLVFALLNYKLLNRPLLYFLLIPLAGHLVNSLTKPVLCTADARYVFPMIIPLIALIGLQTELMINQIGKVSKFFGYILLILTITFSVTSLYFLSTQHFNEDIENAEFS